MPCDIPGRAAAQCRKPVQIGGGLRCGYHGAGLRRLVHHETLDILGTTSLWPGTR